MAILSVFLRFFGIHDEDFIVTFPRIQETNTGENGIIKVSNPSEVTVYVICEK